MRIFRNYKIKESMKFIFILKFITFIFLIWICYLKSDKCIFGRSIENEYKVHKMSFGCFNRLLSKHEIQDGLRSHRQREYLSNNIMNKNMKVVLEHTSTYGQLNKRRGNDLDSYKKGYRRRYSKKNILGKLECYCEKKVFDKIGDIHNLVVKMQNDKKRLIKEILKKHCKGIIILTSILLIGLIIHILFTGDYGLIPWCKNLNDDHLNGTCSINGIIHADEKYTSAITIPNFLLISLSSIILISTVIYSLIKLVKYERLKMGRRKMNTKDYINFYKEVLI
ncbi:hypothetical protein PVMG_05648 [Plasmodium vivax Mauritania I]|uniref:Variable surface protein n=1 Tax=Plasmodium vivax Mauritania I TaxID=1035515 RepID=A0A0J9TI92_PLAVI|nr:hypothetical protein PVMG_05648 [Plasmodium vivax Mauritania I]